MKWPGNWRRMKRRTTDDPMWNSNGLMWTSWWRKASNEEMTIIGEYVKVMNSRTIINEQWCDIDNNIIIIVLVTMMIDGKERSDMTIVWYWYWGPDQCQVIIGNQTVTMKAMTEEEMKENWKWPMKAEILTNMAWKQWKPNQWRKPLIVMDGVLNQWPMMMGENEE